MNANPDETYMAMALREAAQAFEEDEVPVGCVIVQDGRILGKAHNLCETLNDPTAHAEMLAITQAVEAAGEQRLVNAVAYVTLEPCPMCATALVLARVKRLVFAATDEKMGGVVSKYSIPTDRRLNHVIEIARGLREAEARDLLQTFFRRKREQAETDEILP